MARMGDFLLGIWFLLVALAFWGPYLGVPLPPNIGTALYALMLIVVIASLALRAAGGRDAKKDANPADNADGQQ
jgi:uncharacterized RDD family membrane protein YckC